MTDVVTSMRAVLLDPATRPGQVFTYLGFDPEGSIHDYTDEGPIDPWADRFPVGRSAVIALEPARRGMHTRVRFRMVNLDNDDSDVWEGLHLSGRCKIAKALDTWVSVLISK